MLINDRLRELRQVRKYTLEYVANLVGTSRQTIQRYESGVISNIPSDKIEALAKAYGTTPAYIMGWTDDVEEENMTKVAVNTYTLTTDEEEMLVEYDHLTDEGKAELMKHMQLLLKIYAKEE